MAHSCIHCQKYILAQPRVQNEASWVDVLEVELQFIADAASNGCAFFNWCLLQQPEPSHPILRQGLGEKVVLRAYMWAEKRLEGSECKYVSLRYETKRAPARDHLGPYLKSLYIIAEVGDPAARYNSARPIHKSVASATSFELARTWLNECNETHPSCKIPNHDTQPLRVIEIRWGNTNHEPKIRLINTTGKLLYTALSYCWGEPSCIEGIRLENKTYRDWLDDIPFSRLPKSLQDSITTTWKIGLRFIWIDCLCILQDDNTEKAIEIAKMPLIYRGAYVTISAARSKSSDEGFLHDIQVPGINASVFKMSYACPNGRLGTILLFDDSVPQLVEAIDTRGWTLQEYLLSPRLLIYGVHGLRFSCREGVRYDDETAANQSLSIGNNKTLASLRDAINDFERVGETWGQILVEYSSRTLSHPEDRLLAISGVANYYSAISNDEYLAGIWRRDLPAALMWENISIKFPRPPNYRAPSWSWAAIDGSVQNFTQSVPVDSNLSVISHAVELVEPAAPFGAVRSAHLTLKGLVKEALWDGSSLFSRSSPDTEYLASTVSDALESISSYDSVGFIEVWCLQIHPFNKSRHSGPSGLILAQEPPKTFRRLGTFSFDDSVFDLEQRDAAFYSQLDFERRQWSLSSELQEVVIV